MAERDAHERIQRLQLLEQSLQQALAQKQQFQAQAFELDRALKALDSTPAAYRIIGNIMVQADKDVVRKELAEQKELAELRVSTLDKQEKSVREKAAALQKEVMSALKKD